MKYLQPRESRAGMLALTTNWYTELVFFIRGAAVMLVSSIPKDIQTYIKLNSPLKITLCWNNMKDQSAIKKKKTFRKYKKLRLALAFGYALGMNVQCIIHDSVSNLECI